MADSIFRKAVSSRSNAVMLTCGLALGFALLFWLKLRVVTGVPRTAYADPKPDSAPGQVEK